MTMTDNINTCLENLNLNELNENNQFKTYQIKSIFYISLLVLKDTFKNRWNKETNNSVIDCNNLPTKFKEYKQYIEQSIVYGNWNIRDTIDILLNVNYNNSTATEKDQISKENKLIDKILIINKHVEPNNSDKIEISTFNKDKEMLMECIEQLNNNNNGKITKEFIESILNKPNYEHTDEDTDEIKSSLIEAESLFQSGQYKKSYQIYESLIKYSGNEKCSLYSRYLINLGKSKSGLNLYSSTLKINNYNTLEHRDRLDDYILNAKESLSICPLNSESYFILAQLLVKKSNSKYLESIQLMQIANKLEPTTTKYSDYLNQLIISSEEFDENLKLSTNKSQPDYELFAKRYVEKYAFKDWFTGIPLQSVDDKRNGGQLFEANENEMAIQWFKTESNKSLYSICYLAKLFSNGKKGMELNCKSSISLLLEGSLIVPTNDDEMSELSKIRFELAHRYINGVDGVDTDNSRALYYLQLISRDDSTRYPSCFHLVALSFMASFKKGTITQNHYDQMIFPILQTGIKLGCKKSSYLFNKLNIDIKQTSNTTSSINSTTTTPTSSSSSSSSATTKFELIQKEDQDDFSNIQYDINLLKKSTNKSKNQIQQLEITLEHVNKFLSIAFSNEGTSDEKLFLSAIDNHLIQALKCEYYAIRIPLAKLKQLIPKLKSLIEKYPENENIRLSLFGITIRKPIENFNSIIQDSINRFPNQMEFIYYRAMFDRLNNNVLNAQLDFQRCCKNGGISTPNYHLKYLYYCSNNNYHLINSSTSESTLSTISDQFIQFIDLSIKHGKTYKLASVSDYISKIQKLLKNDKISVEWSNKSKTYFKSQLECWLKK